MAAGKRELLVSKNWFQASIMVMLCGFFVMGLLAYRTYTGEWVATVSAFLTVGFPTPGNPQATARSQLELDRLPLSHQSR